MAYKVEVTADSLSELAGKVLALAAQFQTTQAEAPVAKAPARKAKAAEPAPEPVAPEPDPEPEAVAPEPTPEPEAAALDFDKDVAALVLETLAVKGRDVVSGILSQFGVAKASQLDEKLWPELIAALKDA
jgi:hypothetical protein